MNISNNTIQISNLLNKLSTLETFNKIEQDLLLNKTKKIELDCSIIRPYAFASSPYLGEASFPLCTNIGSRAFYRCTLLESVNLPKCITIQSDAFYECNFLQSISLPQCTSIGSTAFGGCTDLQSISLPECTYIGSSAFYKCTILENIYLMGSSICSLQNSYAFQNTPFLPSISNTIYSPHIYVPSSLITDYQNDTKWSYFSSYFIGV